MSPLQWAGVIVVFLAIVYVADWLWCFFTQKKDDLEGEDYGA
jgi:cbb3-type cytochrome oxidase subunit 3